MSTHEGHRQRLKRRFLQSGLDGFDEAHVLELLLFYAIPRRDTAPLAKALLEEFGSLANVLDLPALNEDNTKILIGPENVADELKDTSVVLASYDIGDGMKGVIGVVGPTRMDYAKVAAKLSYVADGLSKLFGQGELPPALGEKEE